MAGNNSAARGPGSPEPAQLALRRPADSLPSFATIYKLYFDFVWASVRRLGVRDHAIDDVMQEIFVVVHSRLHTLQQPDSLRSWIYGVVRRTVSTYHRTRGVWPDDRQEGWTEEVIDSQQPTPFQQTEQNKQLQLLATLLAELDENKREIFVLAELEEMSAPEIAQALGIPLNTAYSRLRTARQAFEQSLARHNAREKRGSPA